MTFWRTAALGVVMLLASTPAFAAFDPYGGPTPIAVFIERNPWLMVIGSDTPRVTVYADGSVIFLRKTGEGYSLRLARLSAADLATLEAKWAPLMDIQMNKQYRLSDWTDQPTTQMFFKRGDVQKTISAYGLDCNRSGQRAEAESTPPPEFFAVHKALCDLNFKESEPWSPKFIELMLWDYSYAPDRSIHWPAEWPSLASDRAIKRGDSWSVFLDGTELSKLEGFLRTQPEKGAVEVGGKKWAAAYRFAFPSEPVWRKALRALPDDE